ncbi:MAG TPA: DUF3182 family protein [Luteimonas sp.]|nr:DUF3182 family protein [Luteimonas sp.]
METSAPGDRSVVLLVTDADNDPHGHDHRTRIAMAERLAVLRGEAYAGVFDPSVDYGATPYFVPDCTLPSEQAATLGIRDVDDLFGGVVPHAFLGNKTISHPAIGPNAAAPAGWSARLADRLGDAVLPGYSAFAYEDARAAGRRLLEGGRVRVKSPLGIGGGGQAVVTNADELEVALREAGESEMPEHGVVLERDLFDPITYSVGTLRLCGACFSYYGTQLLVEDRAGNAVYGGSELVVVRGGFDALENLEATQAALTAVHLAARYDAAVSAEFPGFFASRRNYDVAAGADSQGREHIGVLEQSWRIGGATPAELAAVRMLVAEPDLDWVAASTHETHRPQAPPPGADVHFHDPSREDGPVLKYSLVRKHGHTA